MRMVSGRDRVPGVVDRHQDKPTPSSACAKPADLANFEGTSQLIDGRVLIMRRSKRRNLTVLLSAVLAGLLAVSLIPPSQALADDAAKPAKKDTPLALRPATATLTASVEPAEAKPGDTVTVKVTAKLDDGYHIYKYSKEKGSGPVPTSFDFFDPAGLAIEGDWSASREPEKHKDPNFPDVDSVEYYEGEVTWSIKLKIPASAAAGKKTLRCQAMYMVCDAKTCSIPGRWTLPDIELTVAQDKAPQPAAAQPAAKAAVAAKTPAPAASATDPKPQDPPPSEPAQPEKTAERPLRRRAWRARSPRKRSKASFRS